MGLVSRPSSSPRQVDGPGGIPIIDIIDMKESLGIAHAPGVVVVLDSIRPSVPAGRVGRVIRLRTPSGTETLATVEAVRDHGTTVSLFFRGLSRAEIPAGSRVEFP